MARARAGRSRRRDGAGRRRTCSIGRPAARPRSASAASAFWVAVQTSHLSAVHSAVAFIGSMVAWCWYGKPYTASTVLAAPAIARLDVARSGCRRRPASASSPSFEHRGDAVAGRSWRSAPRPIRSAGHRAPSWPATRCRRPRRRRCRRPARPSSRPACPGPAAASKLLSLPPKTGQSFIAAFSMPGSFTSML